MVRRVARIGDAWAIAGHATLATLEREVGLYRAALEVEGKPRHDVYVSQDDAEACEGCLVHP